jgi:eukaryotic-like serine/threonine-protein kinase
VNVATQSRAPVVTDWAQRYQVVARIGAGGFAEVYEAIDLRLEREVALKIVDERHGVSARVAREVEAAASLTHPGIVALYDFFTDGRRAYLVWELVRGRSLAELAGGLDDGEATEAVAQVLEALAYAHGQGVVHRDVKPQNVMVDEHGYVKVMDFGIARLMDAETLTSEGDMLGTVAYMSPEQAAGRRAGPPSDVYSAAMVLYELLAGANPLRGATPGETISNVLAGRLPTLRDYRPDLPGELTDAVDAALLPAPADRPGALELSEALRAVAGRLGGRARAQRLLGPLIGRVARLAPFAERALGASLAGATAAAVLSWLPAYPADWRLPLAFATLLVWFVLPPAGLAWLLGALAFPVFNIGPGVGLAYLAFALVLYVLTARRPLTAVYPALGVLLLPVYGVFAAPAAAALLGRVRGPLVAAWAGTATCIFLLLSGAERSPFAGFVAHGRLARHLDGANPVPVVARVATAVSARPCLFQALVWAGFALAVGVIFVLPRLEQRLWVWSLSCATLFGLYRVVPIAVWHRPAPLTDLLLSTVVVASVLMVAILLTWGQRGRAQAAPGEAE